MRLNDETKRGLIGGAIATAIAIVFFNAFAATLYLWLCVIGNSCI